MFMRLFNTVLVNFCVCIISGLFFAPVSSQLIAQDFFDDVEIIEEENDPLVISFGQQDEPTNNVVEPSNTQKQTANQKSSKLNLQNSGSVSVNEVPDTHVPISTEEAFSLLDKAEALLTADKEDVTPLEMIKAAYILIKYVDDKQSAQQIKKLFIRFADVEVSDRELFDIADQLGGHVIATILEQQGLSPDSGNAVDRILEGYQKHLNRKDAVESVLLWRDITDPLELLETALLLARSARPEVAGVLLKKFLDANPTPEQLAEINEKLGSDEVIKLLGSTALEPQGKIAAKLIIDGAREFKGNNEPSTESEDASSLLKNDLLARDNKIQAEVNIIQQNTDIAKLEQILLDAIKNDKNEEAVAAIVKLGQLGDAESILYPKETSTPKKYVRILPRPLVQALTAGDPRVRAAALEVIMKFNPSKPYPGSSLVVDELVWVSRSTGKRIAIVATPTIAEAQKIADYLIQLGYVPKIVTNCAEVLKEAESSPDVELVVVDSRCKNPIIPVFVQQMREGFKTRNIPVAIFSMDEEQLKNTTPITTPLPLMSEEERTRSNTSFVYSLAMVLPYPSTSQDAEWLVNLLYEKTGAKAVPQEKRLEFSKQALKSLADIQRKLAKKELPTGMYNVDNLERIATESAYSMALAEEALPLIAQIRSNSAQQLLADYVLTNSLPVNIRQVATQAFLDSVDQYGLLLRGKQVQNLLDTFASQFDLGTPDPMLDQIVRKIESKMTPIKVK
ncbi:MAG: hypothetical protein ACRC2T_11030 [Thermoguttaceae bacterium]